MWCDSRKEGQGPFWKVRTSCSLRFSPKWLSWIFKVVVVSRCGCFIEVRTACQPYKDRHCVDHMLDGKPLLGFPWVSSVFIFMRKPLSAILRN